MKKNITSKILVVLILFLLLPSVTFAAWWNPFTWKIFSKKSEAKIEKNITPDPSLQKPEEQKPSAQSSEIQKLKKEVEDLKKKAVSVPVVPTPKQPIPTVIENKSPAPVKTVPLPAPTIETWEQLEARFFIDADKKGWTSQTITNALGEKRYYRKEGSQWVRKNTEAEIQQSYVPLAPTPSLDQLSNLRRFCLGSVELQSICNKAEFMPGYYSNLIFRREIDKMVGVYLAFLSSQQQQKISTEKAKINCILAPTPSDETMLDPATQNYLRQVRCGTVTESDKTNYELSRIKSSVDELKYRMDSKISWPSFFLDPIKTPSLDTTKWQVRWDGSGGTVTNSSGDRYQFHCEDNICRSY